MFAGNVAVTVPSAPVVGTRVIVPEVALPMATEPAVPLEPRLSAPFTKLDTVTVVHAPEPFEVRRFPAEPPEVQPEPPEMAAQVGLALAP